MNLECMYVPRVSDRKNKYKQMLVNAQAHTSYFFPFCARYRLQGSCGTKIEGKK